ncbi:MAG TPA: hypothetical protein VJK54_00530 [Chthoniobacterales bacterium]|nr:hypothetical protein [Chthoniobacterales bacterium]
MKHTNPYLPINQQPKASIRPVVILAGTLSLVVSLNTLFAESHHQIAPSMMMNPSLEEEAEVLGKAVGILKRDDINSESAVLGSQDVESVGPETSQSQSMGISSEGEGYQSKAQIQSLRLEAMCKKYKLQEQEAQEAGKTTLAAVYREIAETSQGAVDTYKLSVESNAMGKENEAIAWNNKAAALDSKADCQVKAIEAAQAEQKELAVDYREVAETYQRSADASKLSLECLAPEKFNQGFILSELGRSFNLKATYQVKAIEAQEAGKSILAAVYREAVGIFRRTTDEIKLALEREIADRIDAGISKQNEEEDSSSEENQVMYISWPQYIDYFMTKANYQVKAIEAEQAGQRELTVDYREAAETYQRLADVCKLRVKRYDSYYGILWTSCTLNLKLKADYQVKGIEAQKSGKIEFATSYREVAETYQKAVDIFKLSAEQYDKEESSLFRQINLGKILESKARFQVKGIEAQELGKREFTACYREAVETYQQAADACKLSISRNTVQERVEDLNCREKELNFWNDQGVFLGKKADYQVKAIEAEKDGKKDLSLNFREVAETYQRAADAFKLGGERIAEGKKIKSDCLNNQGVFLESKADYQVQAIKAEQAGQRELTVDYREMAETYQRAADAYKLADEKSAEGKQSEADSWKWQGRCFKAKAHYQDKATWKNKRFAVDYREVAEMCQRAADQYRESALAKATGKDNDYNCLWRAAEITREETIRKAIAAEETALAKATSKDSNYNCFWRTAKITREETQEEPLRKKAKDQVLDEVLETFNVQCACITRKYQYASDITFGMNR